MLSSPANSHVQRDFIRLNGRVPDGGGGGGWRKRPGAGRRSGPLDASPYPRRRQWDHRGRGPAGAPSAFAEPAQAGGCPWIRPGKKYSRGVVGLHEEIEDFFQHMTPTKDEHHLRSTVLERIRSVIRCLWSEAQVFIFGSFETGLYLPTSDIDVVVIGKWRGSPLEMLKDALIAGGVCHYDSVKVLDKAAVPIIKLTDLRSQIKVDISFNMNNGLVSANRIKQLMAEFPHLPRLVMVLKQFLLQRKLNEVFTGGISSYSVILMVTSFLQTHERHLAGFPGCNLGVLLLEFFELYGVKFNYHGTCIRVRAGGYAPRSEVEYQFVGQSAHNSPLCIEDPHNRTNDIGRSSYHMMNVKKAFCYAYHRLRFSVLGSGSDSDPNRGSILGRIVSVPETVEEFRRWIAATFPSPEPAGLEEAEEEVTRTPDPEAQLTVASENGFSNAGVSQHGPAITASGRPSAAPPPTPPTSTKPGGPSEWWTDACQTALKARRRAQNVYRRRGSRDSFLEYTKARAYCRRVIREAKAAAGIGCRGGEHGKETDEAEKTDDDSTPVR